MSRPKRILQWLLAVFMTAAGIGHFVRPALYVALIPPFLPAPELLVYASGVAETACGILLMVPRTRRWAAWGLVATLIAIYPANIYHAASGGLSSPDLPPAFANGTLAIIRLPFQFVFLAWAWWYTRKD